MSCCFMPSSPLFNTSENGDLEIYYLHSKIETDNTYCERCFKSEISHNMRWTMIQIGQTEDI